MNTAPLGSQFIQAVLFCYMLFFAVLPTFVAVIMLVLSVCYKDGITVLTHAQRGFVLRQHEAEHHLQAELTEPEDADQNEREAKPNGIIATLKSLFQTEDGKVDDNLIKRFIGKVVPVGNNTFEWYIDLDKRHHAKAVLSTTGRKNNSTIKLEEIIAISPSLSQFSQLFQNSPLSATPHRLLSRKASNC